MNVVNLCEKKKKKGDMVKYHWEKSTYCFTHLYKIPISNLLYITAHEGVCSKL